MSARKPNLIEPEGVNAGSADSTVEGEVPHGDVRGGGEPDRAEEQAERSEEDVIVDQPFMPRDPTAPSLDQSVEEGAR
jgi:hypothetical protein